MNKILLCEVKDCADTVALVHLCGGDSAGQLNLEVQRVCDTYNLDATALAQFKQQLTTRLQRQYNIRG